MSKDVKQTKEAITPVVTLSESDTQMARIGAAMAIIGIKPGYDVQSLLKEYEVSVMVKIENNDRKDLRQLTDAKNILLRDLTEKEIAKDGHFDHTGMIPFENSCVKCKGHGEIYKFYRVEKTVDCAVCEGTGTKQVPCKSCKGTGRYVRNYGDVHIDVECNRCDKDPETGKASGKVTVKCSRCHATGKLKILAIDSKIKSTTHCHACKGRGFILPESETGVVIPDNPVLSEDLASKIKTVPMPDIPDFDELPKMEPAKIIAPAPPKQ